MGVMVTATARLHIGFRNLSLARDRLYGGIGVALSEPRLIVEADRADVVDAPHPAVTSYVDRVVEVLDVPGARVRVRETFRRHAGLGSGTQLALSTYIAVAQAYDLPSDVRNIAPTLGRGGRSGVGVGTFEGGGFVLDAGHRSTRFTDDRPPDGTWTVPPVVARRPVPTDWRFVIACLDAQPGRSGEEEDDTIRTVVERADPGIADEIGRVVLDQLLPSVAEGDVDAFGRAVETIGRLNGAWYADAQGGIYRPVVGDVVDACSTSRSITGVGQSSWGPTIYAVTDRERMDPARDAVDAALSSTGVEGSVAVVSARNEGATVESDGSHGNQ